MPRVALYTLGCKLNFAETSTLGKQFADRGYRVVDPDTPADVFVLNTCTVTERADRECRQVIRRAMRNSANAFVIVTGCYAQLAPEEIASIAGVDLVLGAREKFNLFDHFTSLQKNGVPRVAVSGIDRIESFGRASSTGVDDRTRAFLKVQDGCDYRCSFCTIPLARGPSRAAVGRRRQAYYRPRLGGVPRRAITLARRTRPAASAQLARPAQHGPGLAEYGPGHRMAALARLRVSGARRCRNEHASNCRDRLPPGRWLPDRVREHDPAGCYPATSQPAGAPGAPDRPGAGGPLTGLGLAGTVTLPALQP